MSKRTNTDSSDTMGNHGKRVTTELREMAKLAIANGLTDTNRFIIRSLVMESPDSLLSVPDMEREFINTQVLQYDNYAQCMVYRTYGRN